jgi:hypothetical protein
MKPKLVQREGSSALVPVKCRPESYGYGFPCQLRNQNCVPAVVWDGLSADVFTYIATAPDSRPVK